MKLGLPHGSVISPLLFSVVSSESRSGPPTELLYALDLVLMVPTMEKPGMLNGELAFLAKDLR